MFLKDKKGSASFLVSSQVLLLLVMLFALIFDVGFLYMDWQEIKKGQDFANMAVYRAVDLVQLRRGNLYINEPAGQSVFLEFLKLNLKLDDSLNPLPGSPADGPVRIIKFEIYNPGELPAADSMGNVLDEVAVHSVIEVPVKPHFIGFFTNTAINLPAAVTSDIPELNLLSNSNL
ncbi:MAG: hypothetical protein H0Z35_07915 [Thermoanaerobacteraceae bacterium]|nr:hypothetical protein [Thermoanaerobacteraceae bacterium]